MNYPVYIVKPGPPLVAVFSEGAIPPPQPIERSVLIVHCGPAATLPEPPSPEELLHQASLLVLTWEFWPDCSEDWPPAAESWPRIMW